VNRSIRWIAVGATMFATACANHSSANSRPGDNPHDTDSLYKLLRQSLVDSDPYPDMEAFACAGARLYDRLGDDASRRIHALFDTVYRTAQDRRQRERVADKLNGHSFPLDDANCGPGAEGQYIPDSTPPSTPRGH